MLNKHVEGPFKGVLGREAEENHHIVISTGKFNTSGKGTNIGRLMLTRAGSRGTNT
jgi:hypothetical protein